MSKIDDIKRIKTLLDDGIITQSEFDKLKGQILRIIENKQPESIKRIKTLLDDGRITQSEFDKLKGQILRIIENKQPESNVYKHHETSFSSSSRTIETTATPIEEVDSEPSKGRWLIVALVYIAAIVFIGGAIYWTYHRKLPPASGGMNSGTN